MAYFKIGSNDYSNCVSGLSINTSHVYNTQTNAAGNSVVDYINSKRKIEVEVIALDAVKMLKLQQDINAFSVSITFLNPYTNALEENVKCIIPSNDVEYYTIQANKTMFKAAKLAFTEL